MRGTFAAAGLLVALAGCGGDDETPASVVPADAALYASFDASAPALRLPAEAVSSEPDLVRPWVGERAAVFALADAPNRLAAVFAVHDEERAQAFAREVEASGELVAELVDGHLVVTDGEQLVAAARAAAEGAALADDVDPALESETDGYVIARDLRTLGGTLPRMGLDPYTEKLIVNGLPRDARLSARLWQRDGATILEVEGAGEPHPPPADDIADLPASVWLAMTDGDLGDTALSAAMVETVAFGILERELGVDLDRQVLPHLGAGSFSVEDVSSNDVAARLKVELEAAAPVRRAALAMLRAQRRRPGRVIESYVSRGGRDEERTVSLVLRFQPADPVEPSLLEHVVVTAEDRRLIVESGTAGGVSEELGDTEWFREAERVLGARPRLYVDLVRMRQDVPAAERLGADVLAASELDRGGRRVLRFVLLRP